jgi:hypothetical protein
MAKLTVHLCWSERTKEPPRATSQARHSAGTLCSQNKVRREDEPNYLALLSAVVGADFAKGVADNEQIALRRARAAQQETRSERMSDDGAVCACKRGGRAVPESGTVRALRSSRGRKQCSTPKKTTKEQQQG